MAYEWPLWADRRWRDRVGSEPRSLLKGALRRAVDIRDQNAAAGGPLGARPLFLVDVLHAAFDALGFEVGDLWSDA